MRITTRGGEKVGGHAVKGCILYHANTVTTAARSGDTHARTRSSTCNEATDTPRTANSRALEEVRRESVGRGKRGCEGGSERPQSAEHSHKCHALVMPRCTSTRLGQQEDEAELMKKKR